MLRACAVTKSIDMSYLNVAVIFNIVIFMAKNLYILSAIQCKMQIKDLKPKQGNVDVTIDVIDVEAPREFQKFGKPGRVANAIAKDETGDIKLTLWNEDIDRIKAGDKIKITNGYVNEWQGEMQLTTGRMGKMEVIGKADASSSKESDSQIRTNIPKEENNDAGEDLNVEEEDVEDSDDEEI